jgi:threonine dehydrogenase-like Zn-dependent dehydrogenase
MGHEFTGTVTAIGEGVDTNLVVGDKVVVNPLYFCKRCRACLAGNTHVCKTLRFYGIDTDGGMAEYAAIPESCLLKLPEDMDFKLATLIEPVAVVVHGLRMIKKMFYGSAAVIGLGPMGLLSALMLKDSGVSKLFCIETNPQRIEMAKALGLTVLNPMTEDVKEYIHAHNDGEGVDILVEASGSAAAAKMMTEITGVRGEILLLSVFKEPTAIDLRTINFAEQQIIGTRVYTGLDYKDAIDYLSKEGEKLSPVISHVKPLEEGQAVFQEIISGKTNTMKVLLKVSD